MLGVREEPTFVLRGADVHVPPTPIRKRLYSFLITTTSSSKINRLESQSFAIKYDVSRETFTGALYYVEENTLLDCWVIIEAYWVLSIFLLFMYQLR